MSDVLELVLVVTIPNVTLWFYFGCCIVRITVKLINIITKIFKIFKYFLIPKRKCNCLKEIKHIERGIYIWNIKFLIRFVGCKTKTA